MPKKMKFLWCITVFQVVYVTADVMYVGTENVNTTMPEIRICTSVPIDTNNSYHLTRFQPVAGKNIHHIVLVACGELQTDEKYWDCGGPEMEPGYVHAGHCKSGHSKWLYGWAFRATKEGLSLPEGYAFQVGKDTIYKNLIFEVHYAEPTVEGHIEESKAGIHITYETKPVTNVEIETLDIKGQTGFEIPAKQKKAVDVVARVPHNMNPLKFHVHIHGLGTKVSAYLIKKNNQNLEKPIWTALGVQSPPFPQDHFLVANTMPMEYGDLLGMRCTYYNFKNYNVKLGNSDNDEMCEFAVLYSMERKNITTSSNAKGHQGDWKEMGLKNIPPEA